MIERIPQRGMDDCAICVAAMVMGSPYSYERVLQDSNKYSKIDAEGKFIPWWETYLIDEGFSLQRWRWSETDLGSIALAITMLLEDTAGILTMSVPHLKRGHIVAVDRMGIVDPGGRRASSRECGALYCGSEVARRHIRRRMFCHCKSI